MALVHIGQPTFEFIMRSLPIDDLLEAARDFVIVALMADAALCALKAFPLIAKVMS